MHFGWLLHHSNVGWDLTSTTATSFYLTLSVLASSMTLIFCLCVTLPRVPAVILVVVRQLDLNLRPLPSSDP